MRPLHLGGKWAFAADSILPRRKLATTSGRITRRSQGLALDDAKQARRAAAGSGASVAPGTVIRAWDALASGRAAARTLYRGMVRGGVWSMMCLF